MTRTSTRTPAAHGYSRTSLSTRSRLDQAPVRPATGRAGNRLRAAEKMGGPQSSPASIVRSRRVKTVLQIASRLPHKISSANSSPSLVVSQTSATCGLRAVHSPDQRPPPRPEPAQKCQIATSATANFTSADGGRQVRVNGAGSSGGAQHGHLSDRQCAHCTTHGKREHRRQG
jgi:hypothetical protein